MGRKSQPTTLPRSSDLLSPPPDRVAGRHPPTQIHHSSPPAAAAAAAAEVRFKSLTSVSYPFGLFLLNGSAYPGHKP